ncbi:TPR repeat region-containing protein [Streptomyces millisiae]|uniref:TPR repeat domain-containing protein n=1 Tax=Streptomyces millisiae TaxID=3075542 RepID=A0ABU2LX42_9ACTN|nr:hypothetical protein [Streptomyces sp. DSM 44918]MDT0322126.1 hypothetical protein [Streptomyces sp. DSM 44918]
MPDVQFTRADVEREAGGKPWTRSREFTAEIRPEDMADTAASYARAAGEARSAFDLAREAGELAATAGGLDGAPLVDAEGRIDATAAALGSGGDDVDEMVGYLVRAMNTAIDTEREVHDAVHAPGALDDVYLRHAEAARAEWRAWQATRAARVPAPAGLLGAAPTGDRPLLAPGGFQPTPDIVALGIRDRHLRAVADAATATHEDVVGAIEAYRGRLAQYGQELGRLGYDLAEGPLGLWTTEEMAEYAGRRLAEELARDDPDPAVLLLHTEGVGAVVAGVHGDPVDPGAPRRDLTPAERAYLQAFLGTLDAHALATLGALRDDTAGLDPGRAGHQYASVQRVANGLLTLLDPAVGGLDPRDPADRARVPEGVRSLVLGYGDPTLTDALAEAVTTTTRTPPGDAYRETLADVNGFGDLLSTATVPPGDAFGRELAHTAVTLQGGTQYQYVDGGHGDLANTGGSGLLTAVALNHELSAELLREDAFRESLLGVHWEDSSGAAALVDSGVTVPAGIDHNDPAARQYVAAAYEVLAYAAAHPDDILGRGNHTIAEYGPIDHSALQGAVGDTVLRYLNVVSQLSGDGSSGFLAADEHGVPYENLFGREYRYAFELGGSEQRTLFRLMNEADPAVRDDFRQGVAAWQAATAHEAFTDDRDAPAALQSVGRVAGFLDHADRAVDDAGLATKHRITAMNGLSTAFWVAGGLASVSGPVSAGISLGAFGLVEGLRYTLPDPGDGGVKAAQWDSIERGDWEARAIVAYAAQAADYANPGRGETARDYPLPEPNGANESDVMNGVLNLEGNIYPGYRGNVVQGFDQGSLREG